MLRIFRQYYPIRNIFFVMGEGAFIYLSVLIAAFISIGNAALHQEPWFYTRVFFITVICLACLYCNELYDLNVTNSMKEMSIRLMQSFGFASVFLGFIYFAFPETIIGSVIFMIGVGIVIILIACWRFGYSVLLNFGVFNQKIILLGSGDLARTIHQEIKARRDCGYTVFMELPECIEGPNPDLSVEAQLVCQNKFEGLCELSRSYNVAKIVVSISEKRRTMPIQELLRCRVEGIDIIDGSTFYEMLTGKVRVESINPSWLIFSSGFKKSRTRRLFKRSFDIIMAAILLAALLPLLLLVAVLVRLDSAGPAFFTQKRVGEGQRLYRIYKFRSMIQEAEKMSGPVWALEDDPRVTRAGRILRRLRIDEFPQLWNVLKGEMSFVGPRPERDEFVQQLDKIIPYYRERFSVKPGITGWAQVNYGYGASIRDAVEKLNYDLFYIKNMSIFMDFLIVIRTIKILLFGYGVR